MAWSERKKGWVMVGVFGGFLVLAFSGTLMHRRAFRSMTGQEETFNTIDYGGEVFKLSRAYSDYQDYKDDPNNLAPGQEQKLEKAVTGKVVQRYSSWDAMIREMIGMKFPGYGMSFVAGQDDAEGMVFEGFVLEIPRTGRSRVVVYRGKASAGSAEAGMRGRGDRVGAGPFELIDDFVAADQPRIAMVRKEGGELVYFTLEGKVVATRTGLMKLGPR